MDFKGISTNIKNKFCTFYKKDKKIFFAIIICFVIFIGLLFSIFSDIGSKSSKTKTSTSSKTSEVTNYASLVESKLEELILKLDSVKTVSVLVMVDSSPKVTYLTETTEKNEQKENNTISEISTTVVFEKNGSVSTPIVVTTINPKITGVLIVTNKISTSTKLSIINSVSIVLNIDETCISLLQES